MNNDCVFNKQEEINNSFIDTTNMLYNTTIELEQLIKENTELIKENTDLIKENTELKRNRSATVTYLSEMLNRKVFKIVHLLYRLRFQLFSKEKNNRRCFVKWLFGDKKQKDDHQYNPLYNAINLLDNELKNVQVFNEKLEEYKKNTVIIVPELIDWNIPIFQRPQQLALAYAKLGIMVVFFTPNMFDNQFYIDEIFENCFLAPPNYFDYVINKAMDKKKKIVLDICSTDNIHLMPWIEAYNKQGCKVLYEYIDAISDDISCGKVPKETFERHYEIIKDKKYYVVATADKLYSEVVKLRGSEENVLNSGNGVDLIHFRVDRNIKKIPIKIQKIVKKCRPIIGYFGAIANWFDFDLIKYAALNREEYDFLIIGPQYGSHHLEKLDSIKKINNIHFVGAIDYKILPYVASFFTVATIPFIINEITESTSPIKLFEYMALNKPVVTTAMRECFKYPCVRIAKNKEDFVVALDEMIIKAKDTNFLETITETAKNNSWIKKAEELTKLVEMD